MRGDFAVRWACVDTSERLRDELQASRWDLILCDCAMPRLDSLGSLETVRALEHDLPHIVVSGALREEELYIVMRVYGREELERMLTEVGFSDLEAFGGFDGHPKEPDDRLVLVASK